MQATGRVQISAPACIAVTGAAIGVATDVSFGNGDARLSSALVAGTTYTNIPVDDKTGFPTSTTAVIIVGYGTDHEEEFVLNHTRATATATDDAGNVVVASTVCKLAHAANERVVLKTGFSILPGSLSITDGTSTWTDMGNGRIQISSALGVALAAATNFVDYSTGTFRVQGIAAGGVTPTYQLLQDKPDQADLNGSGFHKNFGTGAYTRQSIPDVLTVTNLGDTNCALFVEVSKNNGRSFFTKGFSASATIGNFGRKVIQSPSGQGNVVDMVRIRAGQTSGQTSMADQEYEKRYVWPGVLEINTQSIINSNGGSN